MNSASSKCTKLFDVAKNVKCFLSGNAYYCQKNMQISSNDPRLFLDLNESWTLIISYIYMHYTASDMTATLYFFFSYACH